MSPALRSSARLSLAAGVLALVGCATRKAPPPEDLRAEALSSTASVPEGWSAAAPEPPAPALDDWLVALGDPALPLLVEEALANNRDLALAAERVAESAAALGIARAGLRPSLDLIAQGGVPVDGRDGGYFFGALQASWELDLWGRVRNQREVGRQDLLAREEDRRWAERSLAASVARAWFALAEIRLQAGYVREAGAAAARQEEIASTRLRIGRGDERDLALARSARASYADRALRLERALDSATRALELLLGRYPAAALAGPAALPPPPAPVPAGVPLDILDRRPDLAAARARVDAAYARAGEAQAARLPRLALTATGGVIESQILDLRPSFENPFVSVGGNLLLPLYSGGALKSRSEVSESQQRQTVIAYGATILAALAEVENALHAERVFNARRPVLATAADESERAFKLEEVAYRVGKSDQRSVLQQQLALLDTRLAQVELESQALQTRVSLHLALGGDFKPAPPPEETEQ